MISETEAVSLLEKFAKDGDSFNKILSHSREVQRVALLIAQDFLANGVEVDLDLIKIGSLLHDIGRLTCFHLNPENCSLIHGVVGAEIIREELMDESLTLICERHIGSGILEEEVELLELPLPKRDYMPESNEEKIITYADNLVFDDVVKTFDDVLIRFLNQLSFLVVGRFLKLHNFIMRNSGKSDRVIDVANFSLQWMSDYLDFHKQSEVFTKLLNKVYLSKSNLKIKIFLDSFMPEDFVLLEKDTNYALFVSTSKADVFNLSLEGRLLEEKEFSALQKNFVTISGERKLLAEIMFKFDDFVKNPKSFFKYFRKLKVPASFKFKVLHSLIGLI